MVVIVITDSNKDKELKHKAANNDKDKELKDKAANIINRYYYFNWGTWLFIKMLKIRCTHE